MSARHRLPLPVITVLIGLAACSSAPVAAPLPATPASSAPPASKPATPTATATATATTTTTSAPARVPCPSAKALEKLANLPTGWHFVPSSVECWKSWATADPKGPTPGDGFYLFRYQAGAGWRYHSQGSGYDCADLGIHEAAPFCQYS